MTSRPKNNSSARKPHEEIILKNSDASVPIIDIHGQPAISFSHGNIRTESLRAFSAADMATIVGKMP